MLPRCRPHRALVVIVLLLALVLAAVSLWSVSIGAVRDVRREERRDLSTACPAWVPLAGDDDHLYRCGAPLPAGATHCPVHAQPRQRNADRTHPDAQRVEATRAWADARRKMRWGIPVAVATLVAALVTVGVVATT